MNIQIFGMSKSFDTKKAERWFKERRIKYQYIDLYEKGLSLGEYRPGQQGGVPPASTGPSRPLWAASTRW